MPKIAPLAKAPGWRSFKVARAAPITVTGPQQYPFDVIGISLGHGRLPPSVGHLMAGRRSRASCTPLFACLRFDRVIPLDLEGVPHQFQVLGIVFDDQNQLIRHGRPGGCTRTSTLLLTGS